jgi:hypothetical protein
LFLDFPLQVAGKVRKNMRRLVPGFSTAGRRQALKEYDGVVP